MADAKQPKEREPRSNQKLKIMYLMKILLEKTDDTHAITLNEIVDELKLYNVTVERKSLYSDLEYLRTYGLDVVGYQQECTFYYQVVNRDFQLAELKLLVDAVYAAKFITKAKSDVAVTDLLLSWVMALKGVKIIGPEDFVEKMKVKEQYEMYR